jgi:hypothetical protein
VGLGKVGSAKVPMATATKSGKPSPSQYTVEPHCGQKRKVSALPLVALEARLRHDAARVGAGLAADRDALARVARLVRQHRARAPLARSCDDREIRRCSRHVS